jgi:hypothetical protein
MTREIPLISQLGHLTRAKQRRLCRRRASSGRPLGPAIWGRTRDARIAFGFDTINRC